MKESHSQEKGALQVLRDFIALIGQSEEGGYLAAKGAAPLLQYLWFAYQRHQGQIDWILAQRCRRVALPLRAILHWAILECYYCSGLPSAVAVNIAAGYAKEQISKAAGGFANAVLRQLLRDAPTLKDLEESVLATAPEAIRLALPGVLYDRWVKAYGVGQTRHMASLLLENADVTARRRGCFRGVRCGRPYAPGGVMAISEMAFEPAHWYLQDPSTLMAPLLLSPSPGEVIADLCAAPGGKSLILAEILDHKGILYCCDKSATRLDKVRENLSDYPETKIEVMDITNDEENIFQPCMFDGILLDVPCSNSGVIRRRPDVRWNFSAKKLSELVALQKAILERGACLLKDGGRMVYSTCSIDADENVHQIEAFLAIHPEFTLKCSYQLLPTHCHDGAFAAVLLKASAPHGCRH